MPPQLRVDFEATYYSENLGLVAQWFPLQNKFVYPLQISSICLLVTLMFARRYLVASQGAIVAKWLKNNFTNCSKDSIEYGTRDVKHLWAWSPKAREKSRHMVASVAPINIM